VVGVGGDEEVSVGRRNVHHAFNTGNEVIAGKPILLSEESISLVEVRPGFLVCLEGNVLGDSGVGLEFVERGYVRLFWSGKLGEV
jgi:hypothetical protein